MSTREHIQSVRLNTLVISFSLLVLFLLAVRCAFLLLPEGIDWHQSFRPATLALLSGHSPYQDSYGFYNPVWALFPLSPFAILGEQVGRACLFILGFLAFAYETKQLGAKPVSMALFLISPPVLQILLVGNLEWLVYVGLLLPARWGLFFVLLKPQVAGVMALWWTIEAWRTGKSRAVFSLWWPVGIALVVSVLMGWNPLHSKNLVHMWWNSSLWPWSIPFGFLSVILSLWKRNWRFALIASPMLSPYITLGAWSSPLIAMGYKSRLLFVAVFIFWVITIIAMII